MSKGCINNPLDSWRRTVEVMKRSLEADKKWRQEMARNLRDRCRKCGRRVGDHLDE